MPRDPLTENIEPPPRGMVRIAFWRHIIATSDRAELLPLHLERARVVHDFVAATGLEVKDWCNVDSPQPSEVVEILVTAFASAAAAAIVHYLVKRIKKRGKKAEGALKAVSMRSANGSEIVWHFQHGVSAELADREIARFADGNAVQRVLGA